MKTHWKNLLVTAVLLVPVLTGCNKEKEDFYLRIQDESGAALTGTQTFTYRQVRNYPFEASAVSKVTLGTPDGWSARMDYATRKLVVTAPAGSDPAAAESGRIAIDATSNSGQTLTLSMEVAVSDAAIAFSLPEDALELSLKYGETRAIPVTSDNVYSVDADGVKGWVARFNPEDGTLSVTAPSKSDETAETEGTLVLTPRSEKGNAGTPVSVKVSVRFNAPSLQLDKNAVSGLLYGAEEALHSTEMANVVKVEQTSTPAGWSSAISLNASSATLTLKAPQAGNGEAVGEGTFVFTAWSDTDETSEISIDVALKGINNKDQFLAWVNAWNNQTEDLPTYMQGDAYVLNCDVDLSEKKVRMWVWRDFNGVFDGNNHRLKVALLGGSTLDGDNGNVAIFNTVKNTVRNLIIDGTVEVDHQVSAAGLTVWSDGGRFEHITSYMTLTKKGSGNARQNTYLGGLVADETNSANGGGRYIDCHNKGRIISNGYHQFLGGLVADVWDNPGLVMEQCTNEADITVDVSPDIANMGNWWCGGLVGKADGSGATLRNCANKGGITVRYDTLPSRCKGIGGLVGAFSGTLENCTNEGKIVSSSNSTLRESRVGGLIGYVLMSKGFGLKASATHNKGAVSAFAENAGGLFGLVEAGSGDAIVISGCNNEAAVEAIAATRPSCLAVGGLIGTAYNQVTLDGCKNSGAVAGFPSVGGAGLIGRAADDITVKGCENSGKVAVGGSSGQEAPFPMAAGLVVGVAAKTVITASKNTGAVAAMVTTQAAAAKVYASQATLKGGSDASSVDSATESASAATSVTTVLPDQWTENIPSSWR